MNKLIIGACAAALLAAACGDDHHHEGDEHLYCQGDEQTLVAGVSQLGDNGIYKITIQSWDPDPLIVGNNSLTILVTDPNDNPVDVTLDVAETWQRIHDHGTPVVSIITPLSGTGEFQIDDLNIIHTGSWLFRFAPTDGTDSDFVVFNFGIQCPADPHG